MTEISSDKPIEIKNDDAINSDRQTLVRKGYLKIL
jgi:hypothetical protein